MTETTDELRWRQALDRLGPNTVRGKINTYSVGVALDNVVQGIVDDSPHPTRRFIETWLAKCDASDRRRESVRFYALLLATFIAAGAAMIAAYPVLFPPAGH